jgi:predicted dinucleotide-binding enzyme
MSRTVVVSAFLIALVWGAPVTAEDKPTVAIIGTGNLAGMLGPAIGQRGYAVVYGSREPERDEVQALVARSGAKATAARQREAAARATVVILAVPGELLEQVTGNLGQLDGKIVVDVSGGRKRVAADGYLELVPGSSNAERIQARHPKAQLVRINLPLNAMVLLARPQLLGVPPTVLIAGNGPQAREVVANLVFDVGLDPWDAGPLRFARVFDAINVMGLVPAQQGRMESYELKLLPSMPLSCFLNMSELFGFSRPNDLDSLPNFPKRDPPVSCEEWQRRAEIGDQGQ